MFHSRQYAILYRFRDVKPRRQCRVFARHVARRVERNRACSISFNMSKVTATCLRSVDNVSRFGDVTFGRLAVSDSELGVDVIDFDECYCYLFTVLYCSLVLHVGPF